MKYQAKQYLQVGLRANEQEQEMLKNIKKQLHLNTLSGVLRVAVYDLNDKICVSNGRKCDKVGA